MWQSALTSLDRKLGVRVSVGRLPAEGLQPVSYEHSFTFRSMGPGDDVTTRSVRRKITLFRAAGKDQTAKKHAKLRS